MSSIKSIFKNQTIILTILLLLTWKKGKINKQYTLSTTAEFSSKIISLDNVTSIPYKQDCLVHLLFSLSPAIHKQVQLAFYYIII
jgi:hypothetical protein